MGQARRRGTYEKRREEAILKRKERQKVKTEMIPEPDVLHGFRKYVSMYSPVVEISFDKE